MTFYRQFFKNKTKWFYSQLMQIGKRLKLEMELKSKTLIEQHGHSHKLLAQLFGKNSPEEKVGGTTEQLKGDE